MADWTPVEITRGDTVDTPQGTGIVSRVSQAQKTAHVTTKGGTFEVPLDEVTKSGATPKSSTPQEQPEGEPVFRKGDKVRLKQSGHEGTLVDVEPNGKFGTFKHKANGKKRYVNTKQLEHIEPKKPSEEPKTETPSETPSETPKREFKVGDRVKIKNAEPDSTGTVVVVKSQNSIEVEFDEATMERYPIQGHNGSTGKSGLKSRWYAYASTLEHLDGDKEESPSEDKENEQAPEVQKEQDTVVQTGDGLHEILKLKEYLEHKIDTNVEGELATLREAVKKNQKLEVKIGDVTKVVSGSRHRQLDKLITYTALRIPVLLVGMAGTGKTHASEQVAEALGLNFFAMSVGAQTSKSDIIGYMDANGNYVKTFFREAYENGGVFLMDEIDAGNANVLIQVNAALSNGLCAFPDAMVKKHKDFVFVASANTYGNGASRQYVGRNQLDAATLDRFAIIDWLIDEELEGSLATGVYGDAWFLAVKATRAFVEEKGIRAIISPRATLKGTLLLSAGVQVDEVIKSVLLGSVPEDKKAMVTEVATKVFDDKSRDVPSKVAEAIQTSDMPF